ncbi:MAG: DNA polymerase III subunit delta, partial [Bacteroidales bacterium]|nr:DNA polymerase III subunit delta [Bacteroidales bacterium]
SQLYSYFNKITIYHTLKDKSRNNAAAAMGVSPFFVEEYRIAANNYSLVKLMQIVSFLRDADIKSKGVDASSVEEADIMKELVFKILH